MRSMTLLALVVGTTMLLGTLPATYAAEKTKTVKALIAAKQVDALQPDAQIWSKAPATKVGLQPAFPGHPSIVGTPRIAEVRVQAVRSEDRLFVRLEWDDASANGQPVDTASFSDGVAVQFPVNGKTATIPFMGDAKNAVNVWYWRADGRVEELIAGGFGTATSLRTEGEVTGVGSRTPKGWQVVLTRKLAGQKESVNLKRFREIPVAFAAWDGANQERDGFKAVTLEWWRLKL